MTDVPTERVTEILAATRDHRLVPEHLSYDRHEIEALLTELLALRAALNVARSVISEMVEAGVIHNGERAGGYYVGDDVVPIIMGRKSARALQSHSTGDDK